MNIDNLELVNDEAQERNKQEKAESRTNKTCAKQQVRKKCPCNVWIKNQLNRPE